MGDVITESDTLHTSESLVVSAIIKGTHAFAEHSARGSLRRRGGDFLYTCNTHSSSCVDAIAKSQSLIKIYFCTKTGTIKTNGA